MSNVPNQTLHDVDECILSILIHGFATCKSILQEQGLTNVTLKFPDLQKPSYKK